MTSAKENFNNHVKKFLFSGYQSVPFSCHFCPSQMKMESDHGRKDKGYAWAQQHKTDLDIATAQCPTCQGAKCEIFTWHRSLGSLAIYPLAEWLFGPFELWKGWCFIFTGIDISLKMDFPSLPPLLLPRSASMDVLNPSHPYTIPYLTPENSIQHYL